MQSSWRRRASSRRPRWRRSAQRRPRPRVARSRQVLLRRRPRLSRALRPSSGLRRAPARGDRCRAPAGVVRSRARRRDPLRRRHLGRRRRPARGRPLATTAPISLDLGALDRVLEVDPVSRAARIQAGAIGPGPGGASSPSTASRCATSRSRSSTPRSAAGSPRARPGTSRPCWTHIEDFVESVRAHHPRRRVGVASAARLGRRRQPRPDARRLGGHARGDHRGVGARAAAPLAPALGGRALRALRSTAPSACARSASRACTRPTAA